MFVLYSFIAFITWEGIKKLVVIVINNYPSIAKGKKVKKAIKSYSNRVKPTNIRVSEVKILFAYYLIH